MQKLTYHSEGCFQTMNQILDISFVLYFLEVCTEHHIQKWLSHLLGKWIYHTLETLREYGHEQVNQVEDKSSL